MSMSQSEISGWISSENNKQVTVICGGAEFHKGGYISKSYVDFKVDITVGGDKMTCRHRFSEFEAVRDLLRVTYHKYGLVIPPLPPKVTLSSTSDLESAFVKERCEGLTLFCKGVVMNPFFRNDNAWIEFVSGSGVTTENIGERMSAGALSLLEQPFKLTVESRIDTIKEELTLIETSVKAVLSSLRKLQEAEKACMAAFDNTQTQIQAWNTNELSRINCFNGYPFDAQESIIPTQQGVKSSIKNWNELDTNKYMSKSMGPDQIGIFQIGALTYDMGMVEAVRASIAHRDQVISNIASYTQKLEKKEKTAKDAKDSMQVEELKAKLDGLEQSRENYYKGLLCLSLPMLSRLRAEVYRVAYSYMGASYLAEVSQAHTATLAFFRAVSINPMTAVDNASESLVENGLISLNKTSANYGSDQSLMQQGPVCAPLMHGLLECAISGNYGPLYQASYTPPSAPASAAVDATANVFAKMGSKFSDSESDGNGAQSEARASSGGGGSWADEESIGV